ncbi:hypothetical protein BLNAU_13949 [Blattamonas nauphoetae]|uniref:Uncharacterized protein n=1 Tax=Blattamonas nauphoetae TaxID=2049346 RepID=A0ABQ9XGI8_9EUKA|nr:hypothetical protein BLNAU_13949 [Blattamonas nauphoetae]
MKSQKDKKTPSSCRGEENMSVLKIAESFCTSGRRKYAGNNSFRITHLLFPIFSLSIDDIRASNTPLPLTPSLSSSASRNPTSPSSSIFTADSIHPISPSIHSSLSLVFLSFSETPKSSIDSSLHPLDTTSSGNVSPSPPSFRPKPDRPPRSPQLFANSPLSFLRLTPLKHCVVEPAHKHQQRSQAPSAPFQRVSRRSDLSADVADISPKTTTPQPALSTPPLACPPSFLAVPPAVAACALSTMSLSPDRDQQFSNNLSDPPKNSRIKENRKNDKETELTTKTQNTPQPYTPHFQSQHSPTSCSDPTSSSPARLSLPTTQPDEAIPKATLLSLRLPFFHLHCKARTAPSKVGLPLAQKNGLPLVITRTARSNTRGDGADSCEAATRERTTREMDTSLVNVKGTEWGMGLWWC